MQNPNILYEVYWEDEDGNTFYQGCTSKEEVSQLLNQNLIRLCKPRVISTKEDTLVPITEF